MTRLEVEVEADACFEEGFEAEVKVEEEQHSMKPDNIRAICSVIITKRSDM